MKIPADLLDEAYPVALEHGIPWHDDAVRLIATAILTTAREQIARAVEAACIDPEWPNDDVSANGVLAAAVVRSWPGEAS